MFEHTPHLQYEILPPPCCSTREKKTDYVKAQFQQRIQVLRPCLVRKNFHPKMLHRILRHMHGVLNVDEKKLITQLGEKSRDETFKHN